MKKLCKEIIALVLLAALICSVCIYWGTLLMPERGAYGALWNEYRSEPENSIDVLFIGSSFTYCGIIPAQLYRDEGMCTYVLAAPCMSPATMYYYLREGLKTQKPKIVVLEASSISFNQYPGFTTTSVGYMPFGMNKIRAIFEAAPKEERLGLLFPMYSYHERWQDFDWSRLLTGPSNMQPDIWAGYTYLTEIIPSTQRVMQNDSLTQDDIDRNNAYLKKTIELCRDNGIEVELYTSPQCTYTNPSLYAWFGDEQYSFINYNEIFDSLGLDMSVDFYDAKHLNYSGAKKFTAIIGDYLSSKYDFEIRPETEDLWQRRCSILQ